MTFNEISVYARGQRLVRICCWCSVLFDSFLFGRRSSIKTSSSSFLQWRESFELVRLWSAMWYWAIPSVDRSHAFGWPLTFWYQVHRRSSSQPYGCIIPYHMAGKFEKRTVYERQFSTCGIPKSVRMEMSLTSSNDSRHCKRKSLKFWSKSIFPKELKRATKSRSGPGAGRERILRSLTECDLSIPHCLPFDELARLPTTETFLSWSSSKRRIRVEKTEVWQT